MKTILFYGDSITDGNRYKDEKDREDLNHQMGHSYAYIINALLGSKYPEKNLHFINRGISGNRIIELYGRIYEDVIAWKPNVVSILVGVNDGPQAEHARHATGREAYGIIYRMMLKEIRTALPEVQFVICEPFIGQHGPVYDNDYELWHHCIQEYQKETRQIAEEFGAVFVPLQECFEQACENQDTKYWIWDGVHPTENGHGLIAEQWLETAGHVVLDEKYSSYEEKSKGKAG